MADDTAMDAAALPGANLRRDYVTTFITEILVIASWLVAFRLVAIQWGASAFGEYALSRRAFSLLSPLVLLRAICTRQQPFPSHSARCHGNHESRQ